MTTLSIRVPDEVAEQLEQLAKSTGRSRSFLALDAIGRYLTQEQWQIQAIETAVKRGDEGSAKYASHEEVDAWLASWGTQDETDAPECK